MLQQTKSKSIKNLNTHGEDQCLRDNVISDINDFILDKKRCILITGKPFMGKTTVIEQFYKQNMDFVAKYTVKEDPYRDKVEYIIKDLCEQLLNMSSPNFKSRINQIELDEMPMQQAMLLFERIYNHLCKRIYKEKMRFFLIIDGLDKLSEEVYTNLLNNIPNGDPNGFHILLTLDSNSERVIGREYSKVKVGRFSISETKYLLSPYITDDSIINKIHDFCHGIPGYIQEYLQNIKANPNLLDEENIDDYVDFNSRIDEQWAKLELSEIASQLLALITYAPENFNKDIISQILELEDVNSLIQDIYFLRVDVNEYISYPEVYKKHFKEKLKNNKNYIRQLLIKHYTSLDSTDIQNILYLSNLYVEDGDYERLKQLISTNTLSDYVKNMTGTELLRENLSILEEKSLENKDWSTYLSSIFANSVITEVVKTSPSIETDIQTLLAIKQYQEALNLAALCTLDEDRCLFLSIICKKLETDGIDVPQNILQDIYESSKDSNNIKEFNKEVVDKWISISANIFPINTQLSMDIVREIAKHSDLEVSKEKLMDHLLLRLFLSLDSKNENQDDVLGGLEDITKQLDNQDFKSFLNITTASQESNFEEVLKKLEDVNDVSAKLFYINRWCLNNKGNPDILKLVHYTLEQFRTNMDYTLTFRDLRIFAEAANSVSEIENLTELIENLRIAEVGTTKSPNQEYVKYRLLLGELIYRQDPKIAEQLYTELLEYINSIIEVDIRAYSYVLFLKYLIKNNLNYETSVKEKIIETFDKIFIQSALQSDLIAETISELCLIDFELSIALCESINTELTRTKVFQKIISTNIENNQFSIEILNTIKEKVVNKGHFDFLIHHLTRELYDNKITLSEENSFIILQQVEGIYSSSIKLMSLSNVLHLDIDNSEILEGIYNLLNTVDSLEHKKKVGYYLLKNISEISLEESRKAYDLIKTSNRTIYYNDNRLRRIDFNVIKLMIKMIPDIINLDNPEFYIKQLNVLINYCDSLYEKSLLFNMLGLKLINLKRLDLIDETWNNYYLIFNSEIKDTTMFMDVFEESSTLLYFMDRRKFFEIFDAIKYPEYQEDTIINIIKFILSKRCELEIIDLQNLRNTINENEALEVLELIGRINTDAKISYCLVYLLETVENSMCRTDFVIRSGALVDFLKIASNIIETKLPDIKNIKHEGFKVLCYSKFASFRKTNLKKSIKSQMPEFEDLYHMANNISNISDRIFVLCALSEDAFGFDLNFSHRCIKEAEVLLGDITNYIDKIERASKVIETYNFTEQNKAAEHLLNNIFEVIKGSKDTHDLEKNIEELIELAHKVNPELAHQLAKGIDSPNQKIEVNRTLKTLDLHLNPNKIMDIKKINNETLKGFYTKTIRSLHSGKGLSQNEELIINSISKSKNKDIESVLLVMEWFIENTIRKNGNAKISNLSDLFIKMKDNKNFNFATDSSLINSEKIISKLQFIDELMEDSKSYVFKKGSGERAKNHIIQWINENVEDSLIIYDPYFSEKDLELFMNLKIRDNIYVVTAYDSQRGLPTRNELMNVYKNSWKEYCDQSPPIIDFIVLCSDQRKNALHDRYIITDNIGLKYGVSFNGMNTNDFSIEYLEEIESNKVKSEIILPIILSPPKQYGDYKITSYKFQL